MAIQIYSASQLVQMMNTILQADLAGDGIVNMEPGSVFLAICEAASTQSMWLQGLAMQTLARAYASTSCGSALDTWLADFNFTRIPGEPANVTVTFSTVSPSATSILIPVGTIVQTATGLFFATTANAILAVGTTTVSVNAESWNTTLSAVAVGAAYNVAAGTITQITTPVTGISAVVNNTPALGGLDAESDSAVRSRFILYFNGSNSGTPLAIDAAVVAVIGVERYQVFAGQQANGTLQPGFFAVVVDDGTGSPPTSLISAVATAVNTAASLGITFGVTGPLATIANIAMGLTVSAAYSTSISPYTVAAVQAAVTAALAVYFNQLAIGQQVTLTQLYQIIYNASPGVQEVTNLTVNSSASDLTVPQNGVCILGTVTY